MSPSSHCPIASHRYDNGGHHDRLSSRYKLYLLLVFCRFQCGIVLGSLLLLFTALLTFWSCQLLLKMAFSFKTFSYQLIGESNIYIFNIKTETYCMYRNIGYCSVWFISILIYIAQELFGFSGRLLIEIWSVFSFTIISVLISSFCNISNFLVQLIHVFCTVSVLRELGTIHCLVSNISNITNFVKETFIL